MNTTIHGEYKLSKDYGSKSVGKSYELTLEDVTAKELTLVRGCRDAELACNVIAEAYGLGIVEPKDLKKYYKYWTNVVAELKKQKSHSFNIFSEVYPEMFYEYKQLREAYRQEYPKK